MYKASLFAIIIACCMGAWAVISAQRPIAADPQAGKHFSGRIVLVTMVRTEETDEIALEKPEVKQLGNQTYLVGKMVYSDLVDGDNIKGSTMWIPLGQVTYMVEFANLQDLKRAKK